MVCLVYIVDFDSEICQDICQMVIGVFVGDFIEIDWEYMLGGMYVLIWYYGVIIVYVVVIQW